MDSMVVNFSVKGPARYLQVEMQLMAHNKEALSLAEQHMPVIRNNILMILAAQSFEEVSTREGKERLRKEITGSINQVLADQGEVKEGEGIQAVYFTSFVMQ
jgi:flagellar FliL protein